MLGFLTLAAGLAGSGCSSSVRGSVSARQQGTQLADSCPGIGDGGDVVVTEWPASEKANLETRMHEGPVYVALHGCELRVLTDCKGAAATSYAWRGQRLEKDTLELSSAAEIAAKIPIGAANLEAELVRRGALSVDTIAAGRFELPSSEAWDEENVQAVRAQCRGATHAVKSVLSGASRLWGENQAKTSASVEAVGGELRGSTESDRAALRESGNPSSRAAKTTPSPPRRAAARRCGWSSSLSWRRPR